MAPTEPPGDDVTDLAEGRGTADDPGLQPERTSLAWRRTGLASTTASLVLARVALLRGAPAIAALCGALTVIALGAFLEGSSRHQGRRRWFEDDVAALELSLVARMSVVATAGLATAGIVLVLTT